MVDGADAAADAAVLVVDGDVRFAAVRDAVHAIVAILVADR